MEERQPKKFYWWMCQNCGLTYEKSTAGEPRAGCPICKDKGVKTYEGYGVKPHES